MKVIAVKDAVYTETGSITCQIKDEGDEKFGPYHATSYDTDPGGRQLFDDLKAGKYGPVKPFTVTPEMIQAAKDQKHAEISAWRDVQENGSIIFTLNGHRWDCGKASQSRLGPVVSVAQESGLPPGFFWTDADNIDVPVTADELTALEKAMEKNMVLQGFKIHERQRQMKEDVDKLTDYKAVQQYAVGWPEGS
ncbi:DUF4376 domain-containing protein [Salmonella enterica subsp. enterica serovar Bareilly]|nr:DUF4376 domain-containing protein [Salmonella enterica subsp. enterica serovar Bareilly]